MAALTAFGVGMGVEAVTPLLTRLAVDDAVAGETSRLAATAALDPATESLVLAASDRLTARRTAVVIAHRLATAAAADRIVILDDGRIAEEGAHAQLVGAGRHYARLWAAGSPDGSVAA